ncbi:MAG: sigma 54-interacting transcriptional regulator [Candidatus Rokubacteria bacterium]|nr:sigma 54-interacting transcriptional regulator [Candidatus Rokubacteria bacterium]
MRVVGRGASRRGRRRRARHPPRLNPAWPDRPGGARHGETDCTADRAGSHERAANHGPGQHRRGRAGSTLRGHDVLPPGGDVAALPEQLLESELFGHERGAFTGAERTKPGMFEVADRGTLFLDEIGEMPLGLQVKLLRALQEREIRRVGGTKLIPVDVRLVSATNRDLAESVRKHEFREELFYRVNVIQIALPPLRERAGDVPLLAYHFLRCYGRNRERPLEGIDADALAVLEGYAWPGNIRELQNVIERACALADGPTLQLRDLPEHVRGRGRAAAAVPGKDLPLREARETWLRLFTQDYLTDLLRRHGGNISQAAKTAGVDRKTLHRLLAKFGLKA